MRRSPGDWVVGSLMLAGAVVLLAKWVFIIYIIIRPAK